MRPTGASPAQSWGGRALICTVAYLNPFVMPTKCPRQNISRAKRVSRISLSSRRGGGITGACHAATREGPFLAEQLVQVACHAATREGPFLAEQLVHVALELLLLCIALSERVKD